MFSRFDWELEVQNMTEMESPFDNEALRRSLVFTGDTWASGFPSFKLDPFFAQTNQLDNMIGKKTWRYPVNTSFGVEITTYHQWRNGALGPPMGFGLSLYCSEWDIHTGHANIISGPRPWQNFESVFLPGSLRLDYLVKEQESSGEEDCYADFLYWVNRVQNILEGVYGEETDDGTDSETDIETQESGVASVEPSLLDDDITQRTDFDEDDCYV